MNASIDLIGSTLILGIIFTMVVGTNALLMDASVDSRTTQQLQVVANNAVKVVEQEVRYLSTITLAEDSTLIYEEKTSPTADIVDVTMAKNGNQLTVTRIPRNGSSSTSQDYYLKLRSITFEETVHGTSSAPFLGVSVITESGTDEQIKADEKYYGTASRNIYLKNLHVSELFSGGN